MTAAVIKFPKQSIAKGGGVTARRERRGASLADGEQQQQQTLRRVYNPYVPPGMRDDEDEEVQVEIEESNIE